MKQITLFAASLILVLSAGARPATGSATASSPTAPLASSWSSFGGQTHEFDLNLSKAEIHNYKIGDNSYTDINIFGAYHHYLNKNNLQVGGEGGLMAFPDGTSSKTLIALMGVVTYNLDSDLTNSMFGGFGLGLYPAYDKSNGKYDSKFSFMFNAGKRFSLWNHVNYKPAFRIMKRGDMDMEFFIEALNFSLMF